MTRLYFALGFCIGFMAAVTERPSKYIDLNQQDKINRLLLSQL